MIRVNGELIDPNLIEETFSQIKSNAEQRLQVSCCERDDEFMKQAEDEVVDSILIAQEAEQRYPSLPDDEVRTRLEETLKLYREHGASWDMLDAQRDALRDECAAKLRMDKLIADVSPEETHPSEQDLQSFYDEHRREYQTQPEAHVLHLVKMIEKHPDASQLLLDMIELRNQLLAGTDFLELAQKETEKESGEIDLDWIPLDRPTNSLESAIFSLQKDEISPVLVYEHSFHLLKIADTKPALTTPFEDVRDEIQDRYLLNIRRQAIQSLAQQLRQNATNEHVDYSED